LNPEYVPVGDSKTLCVNLAWSPYARRKVKGMYKSITDLPYCADAVNPKFRWQQSDPKQGIDVQVWKQNMEELSCSTTLTCKMACPGVYKPPKTENANGRCYTYDVLTAICITVSYTVDVEKAEEQWVYRGGCYENDSPMLMERATPGNVYEFDYIPIEVRLDDDPYIAVSKSSSAKGGGIDLSFFSWVGFMFLSQACVWAAVFAVSYFLLKAMNK